MARVLNAKRNLELHHTRKDKKGDVLAVATLSGILAAKKTKESIYSWPSD